MNKMKSLALWHIDDMYFMQAHSQVIPALGCLSCEPNPVHIVMEEGIKRLPEILMRTFEECEYDVQPSAKNEEDRALSLSACKTYKAFYKKGSMTRIIVKENGLWILPISYNGYGKENDFTCGTSDEEIIEGVKEGLRRSNPSIKDVK